MGIFFLVFFIFFMGIFAWIVIIENSNLHRVFRTNLQVCVVMRWVETDLDNHDHYHYHHHHHSNDDDDDDDHYDDGPYTELCINYLVLVSDQCLISESLSKYSCTRPLVCFLITIIMMFLAIMINIMMIIDHDHDHVEDEHHNRYGKEKPPLEEVLRKDLPLLLRAACAGP